MGKTNFTFARVLFVALLTFVGLNQASAQCPPANLDGSSGIGTDVVTLTWTSTAPMGVIEHCWNVEIGGAGFAVGNGTAIVAQTVCWDDPNITIAGSTITYTFDGLIPGTCYDWYVAETCDGIMPPFNNSGWSFPGPGFCTFDSEFGIEVEGFKPECPEVSPGYIPNGSFTVEVIDPTTCPGGTYDIVSTPVANSSPLGNTPPAAFPSQYLGVPAGTYFFFNAGAGDYAISVTQVGICNPINNPDAETVTVPDGMDMDAPTWYLTDVLGNIVADNDPGTPEGPDADLGTVVLPEGSCSYQQQLYAFGLDNCDGLIVAPDAASVTAIGLPITTFPGTQVSVTPDGLGQYLVDINWATGATLVTFTGMDAAGNMVDLTVSAFVDDNINPAVTIIGANNITIPACEDSRDITVTVKIDDGCDQSIAGGLLLGNLDVDFNGTETLNGFVPFDFGAFVEFTATVTTADDGTVWAVSYEDVYGNVGVAAVTLSVEQAAEDQAPVVIAADENVLVPVCDADDFIFYSFQITDDCADINDADINFDDAGSDLAISFVDLQGRSAFVEVTGVVTPGVYFPVIEYQGTTVSPAITVQSQQDVGAVITLPGNLNYTLPVCTAELTTTWSITISDDCDSADDIAAGATFSLGGAPVTPVFANVFNDNQVYFEFESPLTAAANGAFIVAEYLDNAGNLTIVDAVVTITEQPDNWAPIIVYPSQDINVTLDPCDTDPAIVVFEVTATDNCDGDVTPTVAISAGAMLLEVAGSANTFQAIAPAGSYVVTISATDAAGNTRDEDFGITVTQEDRPEDFLGCNDNINVTLDDNCQATIVADMVLEGNFGCLVDANFDVVVVDGNLANGNVADGCGDFIYEVTLADAQGTGFTGPYAAANWTIVDLGTGTFGQPNTVTITPDEMELVSGGNGISASIVLASSGTLSFDYVYDIEDQIIMDIFLVNVNGNEVINIDNGAGSGSFSGTVQAGWVLVFEIDGDGFQTFGQDTEITISNFSAPASAPANFTTCWGYVHTDDKTAPVIDCPADTDQATVQTTSQIISGALEATDPTINTLDYTCFLDLFQPPVGDRFYDVVTFTVTQADVYTFDALTSWGDGSMVLYQGAFNADSPCENVIAGSDDALTGTGGFFQAFDPIFRLTLPLQPGQTYSLLMTSWPADQTGDWSVEIYSDGNGSIDDSPAPGITPAPQTVGVTRDLVCTDVDEVKFDTPQSWITNADGSVDVNATVSTFFGGSFSAFNAFLAKLSTTGVPTVSDNCGQMVVTVSDTHVENGDCGDVVITRTFTVADKYNSDCSGTPNTDVCQQIITVRKPGLADVVLPPFTATVECDEGFDVDANGNVHPSVSGYPWLRTAFDFYDLDQTYCNVGASYSDQPKVFTCADGYKLRREWTLFDWCNPSSGIIYNQIIKVGDFTAPVVTCPEEDYDWDGIPDLLTYSTGPFDCTATISVPMPTVTDNCSDWEVLTEIVTDVQVDVTNQYGQVTGTTTETIVVATIQPGASRFVSGLPKGQHRFKYIVTDDCGNDTTIECDFQIVDDVEPVAICEDQLNISIGGQDFARVTAEQLDAGSYDNCGDIRIEIRRFFNGAPGPWGPYVDFSCADVNEFVRIELRVWDDANMNGIFGDWYGNPNHNLPPTPDDAVDNGNVCWLDVLIEDKIRPVCIAPHNVDVDCDEVPYDFDPFNTDQLQDLFGEADADDNCPGADWEELTPIVQLHDCGFGRIIRRFRATDAQGNVSTNSCQQIVTINEVHDYEIKFPRDAEANCGTPSPDTIAYNEIACDLLAVSVEDETFSASGDECYKIFRTYRVINWCEYDGDDDPIVVGRDEDCDNNPGDEDVWVIVRSNEVTYYDRNNNENDFNPFAFTKSTACDGLTNPTGHWVNSNIKPEIASVGYWQYTQQIKVYDNIDPVITFDPTDPFCSLDNVNCDATVDVPFSVDENCTPDDLTIKVFLDAFADGVLDGQLDNAAVLTGAYPDYAIGGEYPQGSHAFEVHVEDGCGNVNSVVIPFSVVDCKAPVPTCINGLAIELMPTEPGTDADGDGDIDAGAMGIWATDFIASPVSDCNEPIKFSMNRDGDTPDINQTGIVLTCDDPATLIVEIYAWDSAFNPYAVQPDGTVGGPNYDHCETYILVQDNMFDLCDDPTGTGSIGGFIANEENEAVENTQVSLSGGMDQAETTDATGDYMFADITAGEDYTVTPLNDLDHDNGVSTFDLVLISKHILGVDPLNSPYKMIAADVDNSGNITVSDLIQLRRLILSVDTEFQNNTSWRFVDANYTFPVANNPWAEQFPEVVNVNNLEEGALINGDFVAIKIGDVSEDAVANSLVSVEDRTQGTFAFNVADVAVVAGNEYTVDFTGADMANIEGYQMTLKLAGLELVDVVYGVATAENFGMRFVDEGMITTSWNGEAADADVLFSLVVRATVDAQMSELLSVSSRYTAAEAYNVGDDKLDVTINFSGTVVEAGYELFQNTPNPFAGETKIGFNLPADMTAQITVSDVSGRQLQLVRQDGVKGYNEVIINSNSLPAGVLYYTLETADFTATKKMIIIE